VEEELPELAEYLASTFREGKPDITNDALVDQVNRHVFGMSQMVAFILTKHVSGAIGAENVDNAMEQVLSEDNALPNRIFGLSVKLDRPGEFPKKLAIDMHSELRKNLFSQTLVRVLVTHHLYLFNVPYEVRQAMRDRLHIDPPKKTLDQGRKRLR
jgi:hypothetical protein